MNAMENEAANRAVDSLLNYETVKVSGKKNGKKKGVKGRRGLRGNTT